MLLVILSVWISGKNSHQTLFQNSILSTSILAIAFFLFVSISLYRGVGLRDNLGKILTKENFNKRMRSTSDFTPNIDVPSIGADGIGGVILSVLAWNIDIRGGR